MNDLYSSRNIIPVIKLSRRRWAGHVARMWGRRYAYWVLVENLRERDQAIAWSPDTTPASPHLTSNLQQPKNETTNVVINIIVVSS